MLNIRNFIAIPIEKHMKKFFRFFLLVVLTFTFVQNTHLFAQRVVSDDIVATPYIGLHYGANLTGGDFADRYGFANHLGGIFGYKTDMNWIFALDGSFIFSQNVREPYMLQNLLDSQGTITNTSGAPSDVVLYLRGYNINAVFGFIFPNTGHNPNSGVMFKIGGGYLQHKIRIETQEDEAPQISGDYLTGYDRLTSGLNTSQFVGYNFMANGGIYNFYAGFYFIQGHTYNRRALFWDRPDFEVPMDRRLDIQYGVRFGWMIPVYKRQVKDFYFN